MSAATAIVQAIRSALRARRMTYRELAAAIGVSEPTVKRDLSRGDFTLSRLDRICDVLDLSLAELAQVQSAQTLLTQLSEQQERALVRDPRLLVVTYLLANEWKWHEIISRFALDDDALVAIVLKLDALGIVDYRPPRRLRRLTARNFSWRKEGPVHEFFLNRVAPEFLRAAFDGPHDELRFLGGMMSDTSLAQVKAAIQRLAQEFDELARRDTRVALTEKNGCSMLIGMRRWEFSEFTRLRRKT